MPQGILRTAEFSVKPNHGVTTPLAAIKTLGTDAMPVPCVAISVGTTGAYTFTLPDGVTTQAVTLASGVLHYISTRVALTSAAGSVVYWY